MINIIFAFFLMFLILWAAKKFYFPTEMADHPEDFPTEPDFKVTKKELAMILSNLQRWKNDGKISREEYEHLTDLCLLEMQQFSNKK
jgi:hypothetical protein